MRWVTRAGCHVDRAACAWLIIRHIDPDATFAFIDNDEIETVRKQAFGMLLPARSRDGGDDALLAPESIGVFTQQSVLRGRAGDAEFRL